MPRESFKKQIAKMTPEQLDVMEKILLKKAKERLAETGWGFCRAQIDSAYQIIRQLVSVLKVRYGEDSAEFRQHKVAAYKILPRARALTEEEKRESKFLDDDISRLVLDTSVIKRYGHSRTSGIIGRDGSGYSGVKESFERD